MNDIKKTVLVSGATGFLGAELVRQLLSVDSFNVVALTSKPDKLNNLYQKQPNLSVYNIKDWKNKIKESPDVLINCSFPRSSDPELLASALDFTEQLIRNALAINVSNIINISSQSVYSQKDNSVPTEQANVAPESLYGMTKYSTEKLLENISKDHKDTVTYSNIRLASLTGMEFDVRMTNKFVKRALKGEEIFVNGGSQQISYLDVRDAASALIKMVNTDNEIWKYTYNLGSHHYASVSEIASEVKLKGETYYVDEVLVNVNDEQDNFSNLINSELFYRDFGWEPEFTISLMVEELYKYYTSNLNR